VLLVLTLIRDVPVVFCFPASGSWPIPADRKALFNPVMALIGNKSEEDGEETSENIESSQQESETETSVEKPESLDHVPVPEGKEAVETDKRDNLEAEETTIQEENKVHEAEEDGEHVESADGTTVQDLEHGKDKHELPEMPVELSESPIQKSENSNSISSPQEKEIAGVGALESPVVLLPTVSNLGDYVVEGSNSELGESHGTGDAHETVEVETEEESKEEERVQAEESVERISSVQPDEASDNTEKRDDTDTSVVHSVSSVESNSINQLFNEDQSSAAPNESSEVVPDLLSHDNETTVKETERNHLANNIETDIKEQHLSSIKNMPDSDSILELERVKKEMKMMEAALQGAARQAQVFHITVHIL
jgi:hypothetical protein